MEIITLLTLVPVQSSYVIKGKLVVVTQGLSMRASIHKVVRKWQKVIHLVLILKRHCRLGWKYVHANGNEDLLVHVPHFVDVLDSDTEIQAKTGLL